MIWTFKKLFRNSVAPFTNFLITIPFVQKMVDKVCREECKNATRTPILLRIIAGMYARSSYRAALLENGRTMFVDASDLLGARLLYGCPTPDMAELALIRKLLSPKDICIDVGANIGLYTLAMADAVGPEGQVHSFEPSSTTFEVFSKNIAANTLSQVTANCVALGETAGTSQLIVTAESGLTSFTDTGRGTVIGKSLVQIVSLDSYISTHNIGNVRLLKIDVEGFERNVLCGAGAFLKKEESLAILIELEEKNLEAAGSSVEEVWNLLKEAGYCAWRIDRVRGRLIPSDIADSSKAVNFLFARSSDQRVRSLADEGLFDVQSGS